MIITLSLFAIGYVLTGLFKVKSKIERLGLGFFLAFGLIGFILFGLTSMSVRLSPIFAWFVVLLGIIAFIFSFKELRFIKIDRWWIAILGVVLLSFLINLYWPVSTWDSLTLYDFRAKLFANGGLMRDLVKYFNYNPGQSGYYFGNYPVLISLIMSIYYLIGTSPMTFFSGLLLSMLLFFRSKTYVKNSGFYTFLLASNYMILSHSTIAYSNLGYSAALFMALVYSLEKNGEKMLSSTIIMGLLIVISSWFRMIEPFYVIIFAIAFLNSIFRKKYGNLSIVLITLILVLLARNEWSRFVNNELHFFGGQGVSNNNLGIVNKSLVSYLFNSLTGVTFQKIVGLFQYIYQVLDFVQLISLAILILLFGKKLNKEIALLAFFYFSSIVLLVLGTIALKYYGTDWTLIPDSARRTMIFLIPAGLYLIQSQLNTSNNQQGVA
jgi:hypothetical protein